MTRESGAVSVVALWLLAVLSLAVVGAAVAARSELKALSGREWSARRHAAASYALAEAQQLLLEDDPQVDGLSDAWALLEEGGWRNAPAPEGWVSRMRISDEERKLNVNQCDGRALERLGGLGAQEVLRLLEARQAMGLRLKAKGRVPGFLSPGDVARVLLGKARREGFETGLRPILQEPSWLLTVRTDGKVNVNTASYAVLRAVLGLPDSVIRSIVRTRAGTDGVDGSGDDTPIESVQGLRKVNGVTSADYELLSKKALVSSSVFRIEIRTRRAERERPESHLAVTVERTSGELKILEWQEW